MNNEPQARQEASATDAFEAAYEARERASFVLRLYVAGTRAQSTRAIANITRFCERYLAGRYQLDVVDLYQQPALAREDQIFAVPTLVKEQPSPLRRIIGDLSDDARVLAGLGIRGEP